MKNKIICIIIIIVFSINWTCSFATTITELNIQNNKINSKINETNAEISDVSSALSAEMKEVQNLIYQISTYEDSISDLNKKIVESERQILIKEKEIIENQKKLEEKQDLLNKRLVAVYESGNTTYLDVLLESTSLSDFISRYYLIETIAEYDTNLIQTIEQTKIQLENDKKEIEENKGLLESSKTDLETKKQTLATLKQEKDKNVASLSAEEKRLKDELEDFEKEKKSIEEELAEIDKKASISNNDNSTKSSEKVDGEANKTNSNNSNTTDSKKTNSLGYIFPVAGCSKANINNLSYPSYTGHTGIDVNKNVIGKSVVAVKDGIVEISKATSGSIPNYGTNGTYIGSYTAYGEVIVINHNDGTRTLYGHMKAGSRTVKVGDKVKQGQVLGIVGNTGNVSPRPNSSNPHAGTHLHFEIRIGGGRQINCVNPIPYLP